MQVALLIVCAMRITGCAASPRVLYRGEINESEALELVEQISKSLTQPGADANFAALTLRVDGGMIGSGVEIARRGAERAADVAPWSFGRLEGRADASAPRYWIVDASAGRTIASLDRDSGLATGPDDRPPAWALPRAGETLKRVAPTSRRR